MQDLMRPSPGCTLPHAALTSWAQTLTASPCCAIVLVVESNAIAPIAKMFFIIVCPPDFVD
jgi:MFS superfamily sulfate permease-like transporter